MELIKVQEKMTRVETWLNFNCETKGNAFKYHASQIVLKLIINFVDKGLNFNTSNKGITVHISSAAVDSSQ